MKDFLIRKWQDIGDNFTHKLLLGNGASIAVWNGFKYLSLYDIAKKAGRIDSHLQKLFEDFGTTDFEHVLRLLSQTNRVNKLLQIKDEFTPSLYSRLKKTLIDTIRDIHPKNEQIKNMLLPMAKYMKKFDTILNLNYDLLVYWAFLEGNDKFGKWFKDGFIDEGGFNNNYSYLREPREAEGTTLVFYPHGNLILAKDKFEDEVKLIRTSRKNLLDEILNIWESGEYTPLFVSEGGTDEKLQAIQRSNYLKTIYDLEVNSKCESLVIYGWSFRDEDEHILKAIISSRIDKIAVSVHTGSNNINTFCNSIKYKINKIYSELKSKKNLKRKPLIYFFDSESKDCWIH